MNKYYLVILLFAVFSKYTFAASPTWTVNSSSYQYSMTVTGPIIINEVESTDANDLIGAFVGDECRGVSQLYYNQSVERYISYLMVYSNTPDETITFKIYDASEDVIHEVTKTMTFEINGISGTVTSPYIIAYPSIGEEAKILSYSIDSEIKDAIIDGNDIKVTMAYGVAIDNLVASFSLSTGATARVNGVLQSSGVTSNDFTSEVTYKITSEDEETSQEYVISVEYGNAPPTDISLSNNTIVEGQPVETVMGVFSTEDQNLNDNHTYTLVSGTGDDDNDKFIIEGSTLKTNEVLDYETQNTFSILVKTDDRNEGTFEKAFSVYITDLNDESPVVVENTIQISESMLLEDTVYTVEVEDPDLINDFTFEIVGGNFNNTFDINLLSGVITLEKELDFEAITSYTLTLEVNDGVENGSGTLTIEIIDENDELPEVSDATVSVSETASINNEVYQVVATDEDVNSNLQYSISSGNDEDKFQINAETGLITLKNTLDFQTTTGYTLFVAVSDGVNTSTAEIQIKVHDENDAPPTVTSGSVTIAESTINSVIFSVEANDPDEGTTLSYAIVDGNDSGNFGIDSKTGEISVIAKLDFETVISYELTIEVSDGINSGQGTITVSITNVNDENPVVTESTINVDENTGVEDVIYEMVVTDPDNDTSFEYSIVGGNHENTFAINSLTGVITLEKALDFETETSYALTLEANDGINMGSGVLTINIVDNNDEAPEVFDGHVNVHEDSNIGEDIIQIIATDKDANSSFSYSISSGNDEDKFQISAETGMITLKNTLDYQTTQSYTLIVSVSDGVNSSTGEVQINVHDDNNLPPTVTSDTVSIDEDITLNSVIHTMEASDPDGGSELSYSMVSGNDLGYFSIDAQSGEISVVQSLDFESIESYLLTISVSDDLHTTQGTILVNLNNVNDENPVVTTSTINIDETTTVEDVIYQMEVTDPDNDTSFEYTIVGGNHDNTFAINSLTGAITLDKVLDFETLTSYELTLEANDGINMGSGKLTINIIDNNDEIPSLDDALLLVPENSEIGDSIHTLAATDQDTGSTFEYSIVSGNDRDKFTVDPTTGKMQINDTLDYESVKSYVLTVEVSDGVNTSQATIEIDITDINDETPVVKSETIIVSEAAELGTEVHTISVFDADENNSFTYSITFGNSEGIFKLDESTGLLSVISAIDYETTNSYSLAIDVSDGVNTGQGTITVTITNTNDENPVVSSTTINVDEITEVNDVIFEMEVTDPDNDSSFEYIIAGGNHNNTFAINSVTGVITLEKALDFETQTLYVLTLEANDGINLGNGTLTINIVDNNDEAPVVTDEFVNVHENSEVGTTILEVTATDKDANTTFSYSIASGNDENKFQVDGETGVITLQNTLDYQSTKNYTLTVAVSDGVNSSNGEMLINVYDDNNLPPTITSDTVSIPENTELNTVIHTVEADDPDGGSTLTYSIASGNELGHFSIDGESGEISVAASLDYETIESYLLAVRVSDNIHTTQGTILVNLTNTNDENPVVADSTIYVNETVSIEDVIYEVVVTDSDMSTSFEYSIVGGNLNNTFAINSLTGIISLEKDLDFESQTSYELTLEVNDGVNMGSGILKIEIMDINDEVPEVVDGHVNVHEETSVGETILQVSATDKDDNTSFYFSITSGNDEDKFKIDSETGVITLKGLLDYQITQFYTLIVSVTDGANTSTGEMKINVHDDNNIPPTVTSDTISIDETIALNTVIHEVEAYDPDSDTVLEYEIVGGDDAGQFEIDSESGEISVIKSLNYEVITSYPLKVNVTDNLHTTQATILVNLTDINDEVPVVQSGEIVVSEATPLESLVYTIKAIDRDANTTFTYSILAGNYAEDFSIDSSTGEIKVNDVLNFEDINQYVLTLHVSDSENSANATLVINIADNNETAQIIDKQYTVNENSANGTVVGQVEIEDSDLGGTYTYKILEGNINNAFVINENTGVISVNDYRELNFENLAYYSLKVQVSDIGASTLTDTGIMEIDLIDTNENPEVEPQTFSIDENSENGTSVGLVVASDVDDGQTLSFTIIDGDQNAFTIDKATGEITVSNGALIDYEVSDIQKITVQVTDNGMSNLSAEAVISIEVNDVIEPTLECTNYISPNGDGYNDYWEIQSPELYSECSVTIYDGSGNVILEQTGYNNDWNGTYNGNDLPTGTYFFIIKCGDENTLYKGFITLVR